MKSAKLSLIVLLSIFSISQGLWAQGVSNFTTKVPVIVELFTSEGCSDCPSADKLLSELYNSQPVSGFQVIPLEFHVDYWNRLGWTDPFSEQHFSDRQRAYGKTFNLKSIYTPQMVVQGGAEFEGSNRKQALEKIGKSGYLATLSYNDLTFTVDGKNGRINADILVNPVRIVEKSNYTLYTAITEDGLTSNVRSGENSGSLLKHDGVVRMLSPGIKIVISNDSKDSSYPVEFSFDLENEQGALSIVSFVQEENHGRIIGAVSKKLQASEKK